MTNGVKLLFNIPLSYDDVVKLEIYKHNVLSIKNIIDSFVKDKYDFFKTEKITDILDYYSLANLRFEHTLKSYLLDYISKDEGLKNMLIDKIDSLVLEFNYYTSEIKVFMCPYLLKQIVK